MARLRCDVASDALGTATSITVLLPEDGTGRVGVPGHGPTGDPPVLYLLHGLSDDDTTWTRRTAVERYVAGLGLAVVVPQVQRGWYLDGVHGSRAWTWVADELPQLVRRLFRVSHRREDTFVAGVSMGGYGAMRLALHRPDRFAAAASLSGVLDLADHRRRRPDDPTLTAVLGDREVAGGDDDLLALLARADPAALPRLHVSCGVDDALLPQSHRFVATAADHGIDVATAYPAGGHDWAVWDDLVQRVLAWLPLPGTPGPGAGADPAIAAVDVATTGFVGVLPRGPVDEPVVVTSRHEAERTFGAVPTAGDLAAALALSFDNGGRRAVVVRTADASRAALVGDATARTGVHALTGSGCGLLCLPDAVRLPDAEVAPALAAARRWCSDNGAVLLADTPPGVADAAGLVAWAATHVPRHHDVALHGPRLLVADPDGGTAPLEVPASGAVAGVVARTDRERGAWRAPAGTRATLAGVLGTAIDLSAADDGLLAAAGCNPLRRVDGRRLVVWGARTRADGAGSDWQHLPVRRLGLLVRRSVAAGVAWAADEPNAEPLWQRLTAVTTAFLDQLFRQGAFAGTSPREAYVVRCDATTTTPADVAAGVAHVVVAVAPLRPATFVHVRVPVPTAPP